MTSSDTIIDKELDDFIYVTNEDHDYLDSDDNWLTNDVELKTSRANCQNIINWIQSAFNCQKTSGVNMSLVNQLNNLKLTSGHSVSVDTRTFTRQKQRNKRQSLFNGTTLTTLCSPVNEDEYSSPEANDRTFEVQTNANQLLNGTFNKNLGNNTFTMASDAHQLNDMEDVEKIAKLQEDSLRQSCSTNGWSVVNQSPNRTQLYTRNINTNTLTKGRLPTSHSRVTDAMVDDLSHFHLEYDDLEDDNQYYDETMLSPEDSFRKQTSYTSTPLVNNRNLNYNSSVNRQPMVSKIMPDISNLKAHSGYGVSKVGRSEPNLTRRLQPLGRGMAYNSTNNRYASNRTTENNTSNRPLFLESKTPSDSRLIVRPNGLRPPNHNLMTTNMRRDLSPPSIQCQQLLNRKIGNSGALWSAPSNAMSNKLKTSRQSYR
ncbi:uncharacterized protein LOC128952710 isoform X2 [Oppia nitens]|uniref:uncharacterized protein LOC128952710 isoform X2 n=1 Tax=Oppia nitens TaxID=1686743 RepID=UPI0023DBCFEA|nr:uncharacterized protein LOC128952710 isoform X2 [Oppia nitens]